MLADPTDPFVLPDGTKIDPMTGKVIKEQHEAKYIEVPAHSEAVNIVTNTRRRLADLPDVPAKMNGVSAIVAYKLFGLADNEIAIATSLTVDQIKNIVASDAYANMYKAVVASVAAAEADEVRDLFMKQSQRAANKLTELVESDSEKVALAAAAQILDRAGHRPADVVEHRHKMEGGLTIEIVKKDLTTEHPVIDITPL